MKTFACLATLGALALATLAAPAHAQFKANKSGVEHLDNEPTYMGAFWPGDRASFYDRDLWHERFPSDSFQDYWIVDLNANARAVTFTINTSLLTIAPLPWGTYLTFYPDAGTECEGGGSVWCYTIYTGEPLAWLELPAGTLAPRITSLRIENLTAGRYIFRLAGAISEDRRSGYIGTVVVSK